jgi:hypothetical protein
VVFSAQCRIEKKIDRQIDKCIYLAQMMWTKLSPCRTALPWV